MIETFIETEQDTRYLPEAVGERIIIDDKPHIVVANPSDRCRLSLKGGDDVVCALKHKSCSMYYCSLWQKDEKGEIGATGIPIIYVEENSDDYKALKERSLI